MACLNESLLFVQRAVGWVKSHSLTPGTVAYVNSLAFVVAAADGYIGITQWSLVAADAVIGTRRR